MIPALGFTITTHYCAGELASVSLDSNDPGKCICGGKKMGSNCCSSNTIIVKLKDTQSKDAAFEISFVKTITKLFYSFTGVLLPGNQIVNSDFYQFHPPPDLLKDDPIYKLNRVFRI